MKKPVKISQFLSEHLRNSIGEETSKGLDSIVVNRACREVLGTTICSYISDISYSGGELRIRVNSAVLKSDLFMQRTNLIDKINAKLSSPLVRSIFIL